MVLYPVLVPLLNDSPMLQTFAEDDSITVMNLDMYSDVRIVNVLDTNKIDESQQSR